MDKTVRIGVDSSEAKNLQSSLRRDAESLAREMIKSARSYSTSAKEVVKDIEEQIRAIEKRNKLDKEFQSTRLESMRSTISESQYSTARTRISTEYRQDQLQTKLLREIIDTIKNTSKEEIREDRKSVYERISKSRTVGKLGVSGDEFGTLKETLQQDIISDINQSEQGQKGGFRMANAIGQATQYGGMIAGGNVGGAMVAGGGRMLSSTFSNPYTAIGAIALLAAGGTMLANKDLGEKMRGYGISSQMGLPEMVDFRKSMKGAGYTEYGMTGNELLSQSVIFNRSLGGRNFTGEQLAGLTGITKSRDISSDLLSQTLGFSRYGDQGNLTTVIGNLEETIRKTSNTDEDFKRRLIQLPEMMNVYNSLASQILQTTGSVNQSSLSGFISGVAQSFGVEGVNLQRYSTGLRRAMGNTGNPYISAIQSKVIRQLNPNLSNQDLYQKFLEVQEDPTSDAGYMKSMYSEMQKRPFYEFRSWIRSAGLGSAEAKDMYGKSFDISKFEPKDEKAILSKYAEDASKFYASTEKLAAETKDLAEDLKRFFGKILVNSDTDSVNLSKIATNTAKIGSTPGSYIGGGKP
jgi:hypothetical protein